MPTIFREVVRVSNAVGTLTFNQDSLTQCDIMDGWGNTPGVDSIIIPNGGAPGAVSGGPWLDKEKYMTFGGAVVRSSRAASLQAADDIRSMFRPGSTLRIERDTPVGTLFMDVRVYDSVIIDETVDEGFRWIAPVSALDPYKYSGSLTGQAGVFAGAPYFRAYLAGTYNSTFDADVAGWTAGASTTLTWTAAQDNIGQGGAMQLTRTGTTGDATATVTSPQTAGQPVVPGQVVQSKGYFKAATVSRSCRLDVKFYTAAGALVSTVAGVANADATGSWTGPVYTTTTVPATAAFAVPAPVIVSAAAGEIHYVEDITMESFRIYNGSNARTYQQAVVSGAYPEAVSMVNAGNEVSRRVTITLVGPLGSGDYVIDNETTGETMLPLVTLDAGRVMVIDCYNKSATVDGVDVTSSIKGDWITLAAGANSIRLLGGVANPDAYMTVDALSAWR